jgi:hypothetical protein
MEGAVNQSLIAYLMGAVVMVVVGTALWLAAHRRGKSSQGRSARWLDTHFVDLTHHKH